MANWPPPLVKVRAGKRGSGWAVGRSGVLTALHVVRPYLANPYHPDTNASGVRCVAVTGGPTGESMFDCAVVWRNEAADLALLQVAERRRKEWWDRLINEGQTVLAATGTDPIHDVSAIGFPDATLAADASRPDPEQPTGTLLPSSGVPGRISFDVRTSRPDNHPLWQGLSGAAVRDAASRRLFAIVAQAVPDRAARRLYASPLPDPDTDPGWAAALKQVGGEPVLEDRYAPEARLFLTSCDPAGRPWQVGRVPQLGDFGVRRARDDLAPPDKPYFPFIDRPEADSVEAALNAALANADSPRIILLVGESAVGKSRLAAQVVTRMPALAGYRFIKPAHAQRIGDLPDVFQRGQVLLWLDNLDHYLASDLDAQRARVLLANTQLVIVATMQRKRLREFTGSDFNPGVTDLLTDDALIARIDLADSPGWSIGDGADPADASVAHAALAAAGHAGVGLGEYLAAYAELRNRYKNAGPWAKALIDCVADWSRTGMPSALPEPVARELWHDHYLSAVLARQWALMTDGDRDSTYLDAIQQATEPALGSTALLERSRNGLSPSEVALLERLPVAVPEEMWTAAAREARTAGENSAQAESVALQAGRAGQFQIAESLWASQTDQEPRAAFNLAVMRRLWPLRRSGRELPYTRKARNEPGEVVGRDALCHEIIEDLRDPVTRRPHVVIGGMGAGKTALLVQLARLLAERGAVPVPIRLRDAQETLDFRELARKRFFAMALSDTEGEEVWREVLRNDQVVILADGMEEALIEGNAQDERHNLIQLAIRQANARRLRLVITSRPHDSLQDLKAAIVKLEPLSEEAALEYIDPGQSSADARWLDWIVETAGLTESPLYLQLTRRLFRSGRLDYLSTERAARVDISSMERSGLRVYLLDTWMRALFDGHLMGAVRLTRGEREAAVEWLSALACIGLLGEPVDVKYEDYYEGEPANQLEMSQRPKYPEIDGKIQSFVDRKLPRRHLYTRLAASWGDQLNLVEARDDGLRFAHGIIQAYLASRFMSTALQDSKFQQDAVARLRSPGPEFFTALVLYARSVDTDPTSMLPSPEQDHADRRTPFASTSTKETQDSSETTLYSDVRSIRDVLWSSAKGSEDVKKLDLYATALEIDSFLDESRHPEIARRVADGWEDSRSGDQWIIDEAKLGLVSRFGDAVRAVADRPARGLSKLNPAYRELLEMGRSELSHPIRLAIAQEIAAGGDEAFRVLRQPSYSAPESTWRNIAWPNGTASDGRLFTNERNGQSGSADKNRELRGRMLCAWLTPLLVGSVDECSDEARQELSLWLDRVGREQEGGGNYFHLWLEVALAQGFKYAANRRLRHPHPLAATRYYLAEQALEMLKRTRSWFAQLTLIHALCLWEMPEPSMSRDDNTGRRGDGNNAAGSQPHRHSSNPETTVGHWLRLARNGKHPFVAEAGKLAVEALKTGHPERFLWIDESGIVSSVGSSAAHATKDRRHRLWIPPSAGWAALDPRAQQLIADVLLLLNLTERGEGLDEIERRLRRVQGNDLPLCFTRNRDPLEPKTTVGDMFRVPGRNCIDGCGAKLCPYPPYGIQPYRSELSEAFCRRQQTLVSRGLSAPWQTIPRANLKKFWKQMEQRAQSV